MELSESDLHCLRSAEGWLELGNTREAEAELNKLAPSFQQHPAALELRWQIHAGAKRWEACVEFARAMTKVAPKTVLGWIHLSYALHELKRTEEAWDNLIAVAKGFPREPTLCYNLACYACQLGNLPEARRWLKKAFALGREQATKEMALGDPDLQPLRTEIAEM